MEDITEISAYTRTMLTETSKYQTPKKIFIFHREYFRNNDQNIVNNENIYQIQINHSLLSALSNETDQTVKEHKISCLY